MSIASLTIATHAPLVHTPSFFRPEKAYMWYKPDIEGAYREGVEYARAHKLRSAAQLQKAGILNMLMVVDLQEDFRGENEDGQSGRLPVPAMDDVVLRTVVRLLNGTVTDYFSSLTVSQDGHPANHISFGTYWRDHNGKPLDTRAHGGACPLDLVDEARAVFKATAFGPSGPYEVGLYQAHFDRDASVAYYKHLQATGQGSIWGFNVHCCLNTDGVNLHPLLIEAIWFFAGARSAQPQIIFKGHLSDRDWFGPLQPCWPDPGHPQGGFQKHVVDSFVQQNNVEFVGVAEDFCVYHMERQTIDFLSGSDHFKKLVFVEDGTAPIIPNAAHVLALKTEARKKGVRFINHDAPMAA
jgi:nicotinamidase-related amidase